MEVIDERRLGVGVLEEAEKRGVSGGRREQEGERCGLRGKEREGTVVGLWRQRRWMWRGEEVAVDKKLIAMAELRPPGGGREGICELGLKLDSSNSDGQTSGPSGTARTD